jgi:hypothetical protein
MFNQAPAVGLSLGRSVLIGVVVGLAVAAIFFLDQGRRFLGGLRILPDVPVPRTCSGAGRAADGWPSPSPVVRWLEPCFDRI